jgi:cellulose 1,4-beta-cellobiosidase
MDIWEANTMGEAYTPHPCSVTSQTACTGDDCGNGSDNRYDSVCDKDGCDFNSFRMGDKSFLGPGLTVDTTKPITVVTQFITNDNTASGTLTEIRRLYVQNGKVIPNSNSTIAGVTGNSITDSYCDAQKTAFGDNNQFKAKGGLKAMGDAFQKGMVLVLSIWDDYAVNMLWLDSTYPTTGSPSTPGVGRGNCSTTSGKPADLESQTSIQVTYSDIRVGPIGSTYSSTGSNPSSPSSSASAPASSQTTGGGGTTGATAAHYGQCGGIGWTGPTVCASPYTCKASGQYYSQCL